MIRKLPSCVAGGAVVLLTLVVLSGCVPYKKYKSLEDELARSQRTNEDLTQRLHQLAMRSREAEEGGAAGISPADYRELMQKNQDLLQQLAAVNEKVRRFDQADADRLRAMGYDVQIGQAGELIISDKLLFPSGVARLKEEQLGVLDAVADMLKTKYAGDLFIIEGNTDDVPLKNTKPLYKDNLNLGYARARAVYDYLNEKHGIKEANFRLISYGFTNPTEREGESVEEWRAQNRRVSIRRVERTGGAVATSR